jgi:hypothetical protein
LIKNAEIDVKIHNNLRLAQKHYNNQHIFAIEIAKVNKNVFCFFEANATDPY